MNTINIKGGGKIVEYGIPAVAVENNFKTPLEILSLLGKNYGVLKSSQVSGVKHLARMIDYIIDDKKRVDMDDVVIKKLFDGLVLSPQVPAFVRADLEKFGYKDEVVIP